MARLVELGGSPANASERQLVRRLEAELPPSWVLLPNVTLPDPATGHGYEYDVIVVAPHAVHVIEIKAWSGRIVALSRGEWERNGHRVEANPLPLLDQKARVLASLVRKIDYPGIGRPPYVQGCLLVVDDHAVFELLDHDAHRCLRPIDIADYLADPTRLQVRHPPADYAAHIDRITSHLQGGLLGRAATRRRYGSYLADELVSRSDDSAVWLARHAELDDGRRYRIRTWYLSSYLDDAERADRLARLRRAAEALHRLPEHPNIATLRDFGEQDAEFFEVTDWTTLGTLATAYIRGAIHRMKPSGRMQMLLDLARALECAYAHGIVHRHVDPEAILVTPDGHARLTGFERAWLEDRTTTVYGGLAPPSSAYAAPELADPNDYEVFDNSDLFSLGRIAHHMLLSGAPEAVRALVERATREDPSERPENPEAFRAELERALGPPSPVETSVAPAPVRDPRDLRPGDVVDGVNTVLAFVGKGTGTWVYRVTNETVGDELALKVFVEGSVADAASQFRLLQRLGGDRFPRAHWMGRLPGPAGAPGPAYHLVELVSGDPLRALVQRGPVATDDALAIVEQILEGLAALHLQPTPFVLRDLKPENVVISPRGAVLIDLGSAALQAESGHAPVGTLAYADPRLSTTGWTPAADVFAASVILYELLTGAWPWGDSPPDTARAPRSIAELRPDLPRPLAELVMRALTDGRFTSAGAMSAALARTREAMALDAARPRTLAHLPLVVAEASDALWGAGLVQALGRHPHVAVPLARALRRCVTSPPDDDPASLADALVTSEARALALEEPLPGAMPRLYDALLDGLPPGSLELGEDDPAPPGPIVPLDSTSDDLVIVIDGLHFTEWPCLERMAEARHRTSGWFVHTARPDRAESTDALTTRSVPLPLTPEAWPAAIAAGTRALRTTLPNGARNRIALGPLLAARRAQLDATVGSALATRGRVFVVVASGCVYLGHGLRLDVGLGQRDPDGVRARWARAFPTERAAPDDGEALAAPMRSPLRARGGRRHPVGRLAWPDRPEQPWLASGGLSLPERLLPILRVDPA